MVAAEWWSIRWVTMEDGPRVSYESLAANRITNVSRHFIASGGGDAGSGLVDMPFMAVRTAVVMEATPEALSAIGAYLARLGVVAYIILQPVTFAQG